MLLRNSWPFMRPDVRRFLLVFTIFIGFPGCSQMSPPAIQRAVQIASASTSQTLCTAAFVSGMDPATAYLEEIRPSGGFGLIAWALKYDVDHDRKEVTTTVFGAARRRAAYREGLGCIVDFGIMPASTWSRPPQSLDFVDPFPSFNAVKPVQAINPRIAAAMDGAFAEPGSGMRRRTQAIVVVHRGQLIAERYANDVGLNTPLQGHSISKSLTHAMIGRMAALGHIDPDRPLELAEWQGASDPRARITANHLLAMSSGLPWDEYSGGWDPSTRMWFAESDQYAYATSIASIAPPGERWNYSNLGYAVLSRLIRDKLTQIPAEGHSALNKGAASRVLDFAHQQLFAPLGMRTAVLTFDTTETPSGANLFLASARDWARFGMLYLRDGMAGTQRLLPAAWVAAARSPTLDVGYGRGFWLNTTDAAHPLPGHWGMKGAPADAYFARGYLGQFIVIVPSLDLLVVRMGISFRPGGDIDSVGKLIQEISAALSP
jgi:CubicO group peptidase (beta-lactamase class C family)